MKPTPRKLSVKKAGKYQPLAVSVVLCLQNFNPFRTDIQKPGLESVLSFIFETQEEPHPTELYYERTNA